MPIDNTPGFCPAAWSHAQTMDMLIINVDRHFNNIGIIANSIEGRYRPAPVFDNGNSLLSDLGRYDHEDSLAGNIEKATGHPFCANLERQAMELGFSLKINYCELQRKLDSEPDSRALEVLCMQLQKYKNISSGNSAISSNSP